MKLSRLPKGKVVIKVDKQTTTDLGIALPNDNIVKEIAEVVQTASDITEVKQGDRILFKTWAPNYYEIEGEKFAIMDIQHWDGTL
jgi:co-chaperonin GroES (HSP10)